MKQHFRKLSTEVREFRETWDKEDMGTEHQGTEKGEHDEDRGG